MNAIRISGREYPERPPARGANLGRVRRLSLIVDSLRFASEHCSETERGLYKDTLEALAHAENQLAKVRGEAVAQPTLAEALRHGLEP